LPVTVRAPASAANLGAGFDTLALALDAGYVELEVRPARRVSVAVEGEGADELPADSSHRAVQAMALLYADPVAVIARNTIPLERGLGGSAAAAIAGLVAGAVLAGADPSDLPTARIVRLAEQIEGHADNAAASLLGGFVIAGPGLPAVALPVPSEWRFVLAVPPLRINTPRARAVLPVAWTRAAVVANLARVGLLVAAVGGAGDELLRCALEDDLHQPYRTPLFPEWRAAREAAMEAGAAGVVWSGAGSSLLAVSGGADPAPIAAALGAVLPDAIVREVRPAGGVAVTVTA
jgi:homoserine kinase